MITIRPAQLPFIPDHLDLQKETIEKFGLDDDEVAEAIDIDFSQEEYAGAQLKGGLYERFAKEGYRWSDAASKWFYLGQDMALVEAVIVNILLGKQKESHEL